MSVPYRLADSSVSCIDWQPGSCGVGDDDGGGDGGERCAGDGIAPRFADLRLLRLCFLFFLEEI